jgi:hypothetical protein
MYKYLCMYVCMFVCMYVFKYYACKYCVYICIYVCTHVLYVLYVVSLQFAVCPLYTVLLFASPRVHKFLSLQIAAAHKGFLSCIK